MSVCIFTMRKRLVDLMKQDGLTALHTAVIGKKEPVVSHILRRGANPNVTDRVRVFSFSFVIDMSSSISFVFEGAVG